MSEKKITVATEEQAAVRDMDASVAVKIRGLADLGTERGDIARILDIRYQWVRNVLVQAEQKAAKAK